VNIFQFAVARVWAAEGLAVPENYGQPNGPDVRLPHPVREIASYRSAHKRSPARTRTRIEQPPPCPPTYTGEVKPDTREAEIAVSTGRLAEASLICEAERAARRQATQIAKVERAFVDGSRTTPEVSALTGLSIKHCSAYAHELVKRGKLRETGFVRNPAGCKAIFYEPAEAAPCS
jgi:hypothetical protein